MSVRSDRGGAARLAAAVVATGLVLRVALLIWADGTMIDDAYITVRFAQHLIDHGSLVYNTGERVLGVTGPLYAVWIAAHLSLVPARCIGYALGASNALIFAATALALWIAVRDVGRGTALLVTAALATYPRFVDNSLTGMETPLFMFGMVATLLLLRRERYAWLSVIASLLVLVRPEGALWIVSLLVTMGLRRSRLRVRDAAPGAVVVASWVVFSTVYYGSVIPQPAWAKCGWVVPRASPVLIHRIASVFSSLTLTELPEGLDLSGFAAVSVVVLSAASLALFAIGALRLARERSCLFALPVLFVLYFACYLLGKGRVDFSWYGVPSGLAYVVTVAVGLSRLTGRYVSRPGRRRLAVALMPPLVVVLAVGSAVIWAQERLPYVRLLRESYEPAGEFIDGNCAPDASVLLSETGMIGWRGARRTHETAGIVSPEILRYRAERSFQVPLQEILRRFGTDIIVLDPTCSAVLAREGGAEWVEQNYRVLAKFPRHTVLQRSD